MSAPLASVRGVPDGYKMPNGFPITVSFSLDATLAIWERDVKPPGIDSGDPIDTSTQLNTRWHTYRPRALITLDPMTMVAGFDPNCIASILTMIGIEQTITVHFPDAATLAFFGFLHKFEPPDMKEGEMPMANLTIQPTNYDPVGGVEAGPVFTPGTGT